MELTLTWPVGRDEDGRGGRRLAPPLPVVAYALATTVGGALAGLLLGELGAVASASGISPVVRGIAVAVVAVALVCQLRGRVRPLPERSSQVPRRWLLWRRPALTAAAFGLIIGSGALTRLKHASAYALAAVVVIAPSVPLAVVVGAIYGLSRGMALSFAWLRDRGFGQAMGAREATLGSVVNIILALAAATSFASAFMYTI
jgi:hypothetical protein